MEESYNSSQKDGVKLMSNAPFQSLLTLERSQKLDLLIHLITNLRQSLIVCGPKGIGKTTLLTVLQENRHEARQFCVLKGSASLSFEHIQNQIKLTVQQILSTEQLDLTATLAQFDKLNHKLVLIIDDAGLLVPGLANSLIQYAAANPALRVIFSLNNDELIKKVSTDQALDECHFIELPPLTLKQCADFLQDLSQRSVISNSINSLDDDFVERVYRESNGVPGKIISGLPGIGKQSFISGGGWIYLALIALLIAIALSYVDWSDDKTQTKNEIVKPEIKLAGQHKSSIQEDKPVLLKRTTVPVIHSPVVAKKSGKEQKPELKKGEAKKYQATPDKMALSAQGSIRDVFSEQKQVEPVFDIKPEILPAKVKAVKKPSIEPVKKPEVKIPLSVAKPNEVRVPLPVVKKTIEPVVAAVQKVEAPRSVVKKLQDDGDDKKWLADLPGKNYTLQLMALSQLESVKKEIKKYSTLKQKLKFIKIVKNSQEKYILLYGSFTDDTQAKKAMQLLPKQFRKSWVRKIKDLQKEVQ